jgi:hypothetical protein
MHGNMERFEIIGRGVFEMALQPSNSQPSNGSSQPQTSNPLKPYGQELNAAQPPASLVPSSNPSQPLYAQPPSQAPESYSDPNYVNYGALEFLANDIPYR